MIPTYVLLLQAIQALQAPKAPRVGTVKRVAAIGGTVQTKCVLVLILLCCLLHSESPPVAALAYLTAGL